MDEKKFLIDEKVIFNSNKMILANNNKIIKISESESNLLLAFYQGIYKKEDIINFVWKNRAGCVSESSYYKLINQIRNNFTLIGLNADDIVTRPRIGISLTVTLEPIVTEETTPYESSKELENTRDQQPKIISSNSIIPRKKLLIILGSILILLSTIALLIVHGHESHRYHSHFQLLGHYDSYHFYKMTTDKVAFEEVVAAYDSLTLPICRANGHYLYYIREPNMDLFLQCLNPVESAVPKCMTIKERY
ncbi:transcriptional regulator [Proteus mirabilis]|uniref:transcriptional regulator n=1 Tax=Proteus mirabilis TaxID=584 RepID=UPI0034D7B2C0